MGGNVAIKEVRTLQARELDNYRREPETNMPWGWWHSLGKLRPKGKRELE